MVLLTKLKFCLTIRISVKTFGLSQAREQYPCLRFSGFCITYWLQNRSLNHLYLWLPSKTVVSNEIQHKPQTRPSKHSLTTFGTAHDKVLSEWKSIFASLQGWAGTKARKQALASCHHLLHDPRKAIKDEVSRRLATI